MDTRKAAILLVGFLCLFLSGCRMDEELGENSSEAKYQAKIPAEGVSAAELPVFLADSNEATETSGEFAISTYYCTNRKTAKNQYIIDEGKVLWGYGYNDFGQLGNGTTDAMGTVYTEPVKIAENVVSVDASCNGYFTIYLTEDGKLYGMGSNRLGLLGQPYETCYFDDNYHKVTEPVLLMQDVAYASAGMESILALKKDGTVWWWGEYRTTYSTKVYEYASEYYWQSEEDEKNPVKMLYNAPKMILEDCVYAVTGDWHGAAITSDGELYTWGLNIYGDCGVGVGEDDYVRSPTKVLDGVRMVWIERIDGRGTGQEIYDTGTLTAKYDFNVFAQLNDGTMLAAGRDLGDWEKTIEFTGDMEASGTETYSDIFVPIMVYSEVDCRTRLKELQWGMTMAEAKKILSQGNMKYSDAVSSSDGVEEISILVNDNNYSLLFDENLCLYQIELRTGGSRDGQFSIGMTLEEVQALVDCELTSEPYTYESGQIYWTCESVDGICFGFVFDDTGDGLKIVIETNSV